MAIRHSDKKLNLQGKGKNRKATELGIIRQKISEKYKIPYTIIYKLTKGLSRKRDIAIGSVNSEFLETIMKEGYFISEVWKSAQANKSYRSLLRKGFHIKAVRISGQSVYFLEGKEEKAFKAVMVERNRRIGKKVKNRHNLCEIMSSFNIPKSEYKRILSEIGFDINLLESK